MRSVSKSRAKPGFFFAFLDRGNTCRFRNYMGSACPDATVMRRLDLCVLDERFDERTVFRELCHRLGYFVLNTL